MTNSLEPDALARETGGNEGWASRTIGTQRKFHYHYADGRSACRRYHVPKEYLEKGLVTLTKYADPTNIMVSNGRDCGTCKKKVIADYHAQLEKSKTVD